MLIPLPSSGSSRRRPLQNKNSSKANNQNEKYNSIPSARRLNSRPPCTFSGRADNACTNLLGFLVHFVRTRGIAEIVGSGKTADFRFIPCRTHLPRMARATNSCTPRWFARRTARVLLADFWYFWSRKSTIKEKFLYDSSLSEFFSLVRKERKGQKEEGIPLLNTFCRLAATRANTLPRPSGNC